MKIYTRTGDEGSTGLFGGDRVSKAHPRIEAYGTVDETNSFLGLARAHLGGSDTLRDLDALLARLQGELFEAGADLATPSGARAVVPRITARHVETLESEIDRYEERLPPLKHFILPGGTPAGAALHVARTVCRRAERLVVDAAGSEAINDQVGVYLNRLSDLLFVLARYANQEGGVAETPWHPRDSSGKVDEIDG